MFKGVFVLLLASAASSGSLAESGEWTTTRVSATYCIVKRFSVKQVMTVRDQVCLKITQKSLIFVHIFTMRAKLMETFISEQPINFMESCTIPGCHYPHPFRQKVQKSSINCQIKGLASPQYHVECAMACRKGWKPLDDIDSTICSPLNLPLDRKKLTNFTLDYLECKKIL